MFTVINLNLKQSYTLLLMNNPTHETSEYWKVKFGNLLVYQGNIEIQTIRTVQFF
jgi:predicted secreted protein